MSACVKCGGDFATNGGQCVWSQEIDFGSAETGGGSSARVVVCGKCGNGAIQEGLRLMQAQFQALAAAGQNR